MLSVQKMELAEVNDEFAKSLGAFDTLVALKQNLKEGITLEKNETAKQKARGEMLEAISQETKFDIPEKMIGFEEARLLDDLKLQINNQFNISFENYLASVKKTEEEIKQSEKRMSKETETIKHNGFEILKIKGKNIFVLQKGEVKDYLDELGNSLSKEHAAELNAIFDYIQQNIN
jgi:FKBP-type peptidyl-prolyl cis-trans isomerase (trigger factor)